MPVLGGPRIASSDENAPGADGQPVRRGSSVTSAGHESGVPRFALLSHALPPFGLGQAVILQRLLEGFRPDSYCLLSKNDYRRSRVDANCERSCHARGAWPARFYFVGETWGHVGTGPGLLRSVARTTGAPLRAAKIFRVLQKEKSQVLVVCSGNLVDLPAGFAASRAAGIPMLAYMFDDYRYQHYGRAQREVASVLERMSLCGAQSVLVPNEFTADAYTARYGVRPRIVRNMVDEAHLSMDPQATWPRVSGEVRIVYAGGIYRAQGDSLARMMDAVASWSRLERVTLHVYSSQTSAQIEASGIPPGATLHRHVGAAEMPSLLRQADILLLPLAFSSGIPEVIRTSSPGKLGEYLASGAPILAHAPRDSFLTWYIRKHNCGVVCDSPDATDLQRALALLVDDGVLRRAVTTNAVACAHRDFNAEDARASFAEVLREIV